ncbi:hypothetical protein IMY05_010G0102300 [Salix suchowensis]|nr:hypothetical protein IMY05_010G0102300 [Salix suchowensis]
MVKFSKQFEGHLCLNGKRLSLITGSSRKTSRKSISFTATATPPSTVAITLYLATFSPPSRSFFIWSPAQGPRSHSCS